MVITQIIALTSNVTNKTKKGQDLLMGRRISLITMCRSSYYLEILERGPSLMSSYVPSLLLHILLVVRQMSLASALAVFAFPRKFHLIRNMLIDIALKNHKITWREFLKGWTRRRCDRCSIQAPYSTDGV